MGKNDYFVIVYYILKYLYECLKNGKFPDENILRLKCYPVEVEHSYIEYVYENLIKENYIDGLKIISMPRLGVKENIKYFKNFDMIRITPKGIEYLEENSLMKKAYTIVKDFKPW